jgi:putative FmdB family regulatory protein
MAAYDYRCRTCDSVFEARHSITEQAPDVRCPGGHRDVSRIWSAVAVVGRSAAAGPSAPATAGGCCGGACGCGG